MSKRDDDIQMLYEWWLRNGGEPIITGAERDELMDIVWQLVMSTDKVVDEP